MTLCYAGIYFIGVFIYSTGQFTLRDMYEQFQNIMKMGPFGQIMVNIYCLLYAAVFAHMTIHCGNCQEYHVHICYTYAIGSVVTDFYWYKVKCLYYEKPVATVKRSSSLCDVLEPGSTSQDCVHLCWVD